MNPSIWNLLHDGCIETASGQVPGTVRLGIGLIYLRELFPEDGRLILLTLHNCLQFEFQPCEGCAPLTALDAIAQHSPDILSTEDDNGVNYVCCSDGTLRVVASDYSLALDSGRTINCDELDAVAISYWKDFERRSR